MRDRIVDFILLAALIVIAAIIVWTLFGSTFRRDVRPIPTPQPRNDAELVNPADDAAPPPDPVGVVQDEPLGSVQPVDLEEPSTQNPQTSDTVAAQRTETGNLETDDLETGDLETGGAEADVTAVDLDDEGTAVAEADEALSEAAENLAENSAESTPSLSAGSFELERVGFSFVTGGPGSCGIVLEAWTHVAVSDDILSDYPCGSEVTVALDETVGGRDSFSAIVGDTMNASNSQTVNIYVGEDEPALEYGVRTGRLEP